MQEDQVEQMPPKPLPYQPELRPIPLLDVMSYRDELIRRGEKFIKNYSTLKPREASSINAGHAKLGFLPWWGELQAFDTKGLAKKIPSLSNIQTSSILAFAKTQDFKLFNSAVLNDDAFKQSKNAEADTVLFVSDRAFEGVSPRIPAATGEDSLVCKNPNLNNVIGIGENILKHAVSGKVSHSFLIGPGILSEAKGVQLIDVDLINQDGHFHFDNVNIDDVRNPDGKVDAKYMVVKAPQHKA